MPVGGPTAEEPDGDPSGRRSIAGPGADRLGDVTAWVLLYGSRRVLAVGISVVIMALLLAIGTIWEFEMERLVVETRAVQTLFNTLLGGVILFVSVVVSINTAALSQEFAPLQVKLARIEDSIEFQHEFEALVEDGVSPAGMGPFLKFVIRALRSKTDSLYDAGERATDEQARGELHAFTDSVETHLRAIERRLGTSDRRLSMVLLSGLEYPYARHINAVRRLRAVHADALPEEGDEALEAVLSILVVLASGREYFTTLYFKRELRNLSSNLVVLSLPVIVFTAYVLLAIDANLFPQVTIPGVSHRLLYVSVAFVVALSPYVLLSSYMLRIVTVSKYSLESTVFALEHESELDIREH